MESAVPAKHNRWAPETGPVTTRCRAPPPHPKPPPSALRCQQPSAKQPESMPISVRSPRPPTAPRSRGAGTSGPTMRLVCGHPKRSCEHEHPTPMKGGREYALIPAHILPTFFFPLFGVDRCSCAFWFEPCVNQIIRSDRCGHAYPRALIQRQRRLSPERHSRVIYNP
jgi:hypothetical protein